MRYEYTPRFISKLQFQDDGGLPFTLVQQLTYVSNVTVQRPLFSGGMESVGLATLVVQAGFKTDLASIPRPLWAVLPPLGKYDAAAVVHDFLYKNNGVTRKQADDVLLEAMVVLGVRPTQRWAIYAGVRLGGWCVWNKYRRASSCPSI